MNIRNSITEGRVDQFRSGTAWAQAQHTCYAGTNGFQDKRSRFTKLTTEFVCGTRANTGPGRYPKRFTSAEGMHEWPCSMSAARLLTRPCMPSLSSTKL